MTSPEPTLPETALPRPALPRPAPLLGPTTATSFLVGATCLAGALDAWSAWHRHAVGTEYAAGTPGIWVSDLTSADGIGQTVGLLYVIVMLAAGMSLLVWQSRIRGNARLLGEPARRMGRTLTAWYATTLVALVLTNLLRAETTVSGLADLAAASTASVALQTVAGGFVIILVRRVTRRQSTSRPA
jgi:hypothetical protein